MRTPPAFSCHASIAARRPRRRATRACHARSCTHEPRDRHGRLLVECMVAALLLNATALIIVSAALGLFGATQHATNSTQAWAIALQQMETAAAAPCTSAPAAGATVLGPRRVTWREQWLAGDSSAIVRTVDIAQPTSAWLQFARMALGTLALRDARWCRQ